MSSIEGYFCRVNLEFCVLVYCFCYLAVVGTEGAGAFCRQFPMQIIIIMQFEFYNINTQVLNMLLRFIQPLTSKLPRNLCTYSTSHEAHDHQNESIEKTKFNPLAQKDLRGYQKITDLNEIQLATNSLHSTNYQRLTAYWLFEKYVPTFAIKFISKWVSHPKSVLASDTLYLPKIHPNGVPLYDSPKAGSQYLVQNKLWSQIGPLTILFLSPNPTITLLFYSLVYYAHYTTSWSLVQNLVVKLELLPNTEEIVYQTVNVFGYLSTSRVKVADLEHVTLKQIYGQDNLREKSVRGLINREVVFRHKETKKLLFFDSNGIWSEQGLRHVLVV